MNGKLLVVLIVTCLAFGGTVFASELVHVPVNPSFVGGNVYNGSYLLSSASMQNTHKEKTVEKTALDEFKDSLQKNLLYAITSKLTQDMYGENGFKPGHYSYAGMDVDVVGGVDGVTITINDKTNGGTTTVVVPNY